MLDESATGFSTAVAGAGKDVGAAAVAGELPGESVGSEPADTFRSPSLLQPSTLSDESKLTLLKP